MKPLEGPRGSEFTLEGKGYAQGTVTVFHGNDDEIDPGETLASAKTSRGSFTVKLRARGNAGISPYKVRTRDSNGAIHFATFDIRSSMSFEPSTAGIGDTLRITISDWEKDHGPGVDAVRIAGDSAKMTAIEVYSDCFEIRKPNNDGVVSVQVVVLPGVPKGEQTVSVYGPDQIDTVRFPKRPCKGEEPKDSFTGLQEIEVGLKRGQNPITTETIEIAAQSLTISPSTAVPGQKVTISGTGFTLRIGGGNCPMTGNGRDVCSITINGMKVAEDLAQFEVSHDGRLSMTVTVPLDVREGENEVQVTGWDNTLGSGTLTVLEPSITVMPPQGQRGERVTVMGSGLAANGIVLVSYGEETVGSGQSDARGNFEVSFVVPPNADIGKT